MMQGIAILAGLLVLHLDFNTVQMKKDAVIDCLHVAAEAGYNAVLWEVENKVRWETCPECVHEEAFSKSEFREILDEADRLGLEPIPLLQTFGHAEYVLRHSRHADWMEDPKFPACYCPLHPKVRPFLKRFVHEYLDVFGPHVRRFHLGGDEALVFGTCPRCRMRDRMELYSEHLQEVSGELRDRGIRPGVWADMALRSGRWQEPDASGPKASELQKLPPSFTMWLWDYGYGVDGKLDSGDMRFAPRLCDLGYEVIACGASQSFMDSPFLPYYARHRENLAACADLARRRNLAGLAVTSWSVHLSPKTLQYPLWRFAAKRYLDPGSSETEDFVAALRLSAGDLQVPLLDRLTRGNADFFPFDSRNLGYLKPAKPAPPDWLFDRLSEGIRKDLNYAERLAVRAQSIKRDVQEAGDAIRGRCDDKPMVRQLLEGAGLMSAFLDRMGEVLSGRPVGCPPTEETKAYYGSYQTPASAGNSACLAWSVLASARAPHSLLTERRKNPVGLDVASPRLSWRLPLGVRRQSAYELEVDGKSSGKVVSEMTQDIPCPDFAMSEGSRHFWRVRTWNEDGVPSEWSAPAKFTCGRTGKWQAEWIGHPWESAQAFEKSFSVTGNVVRATLHVGAAGFYEMELNGRRVGDKVLDPSPTQFDKRVFYSTYELDGLILEGTNVLKILVGNGWYNVRSADSWKFNQAPWRGTPRAIVELKMEFEDGRVERIGSGPDWRLAQSPVLHDDLREGEIVGNGDENPRVAAHETAHVLPPPGAALVAQPQPAATIREEIRPEKVVRLPDGSWVVAFPANLTGWIRLRLRNQPRGSVVSVRYDERIGKGFSPAVDSWRYGRMVADSGTAIRSIDMHFTAGSSSRVLPEFAPTFQTDRIVCSGEDEIYEPRFTYNGFRYVWIRGLKGELSEQDVTGCFVQTDFPTTGAFHSSDPTLNALVKMAERSYRCNFTDGVPTDCPHREKNGWTGDAQIACEFAQYLFENTSAYEKWTGDICLAQRQDGNIPAIVPTGGWGFSWGNGPGWDAALTVIPWTVYRYRADRRIIENAFPSVKRYLEYTKTKADADNMVAHGLGDWLAPERPRMPSIRFSSSCYWYQAQRIASLMAEELGEVDLANAYASSAEKTRQSVHRAFYRGNGLYEDGLQTGLAMALAFGIVPDGEVASVRARLISACEADGCHLTYGLLGSKFVFRELSEAGRSDLAYRMLTNPTSPSMVPWIADGGGTLWEDWHDGASRNHVMFGDFAAWAYQYLAGLQLECVEGSTRAVPMGALGFRRFCFAPRFIPQLQHVSAATETPMGLVRASWRRVGADVRCSLRVPPGSTAVVRLPGRDLEEVEAGEHVWVVGNVFATGGERP